MSNHEPLRDALRHRADQLGDPHPLTLDDVKGRARGIRRRRTAVTGLAAAAVLAVAVPIGLTATDGVGGPDRPPVAGPSVSPSERDTADASPAPEGPHRVTLTTDRPVTGGTPTIPYLYGGFIVDGEDSISVEADYGRFAPVGDGWVALRNDEGDFFVDLLDSDGEVLVSAPSTASLAVSADGTVVSFATPDGELMTVTPEDGRMSLVDPQALPEGILTPVAVTGSESCLESAEGGGCAVFFNSQDLEAQGAWSATSHGIVDTLPKLLAVGGMAPDGSLSGLVSVTDDGSCSVVLDRAWEESWETCDYSLGQFSPDGRYVIGHPAYRSGIGDGSVAILDAETGDLVAEYRNSEEHPAFINNVVWDADNTLVATVFEDTWSLMRMTLDGKLTALTGGSSSNMDDVPMHFATQP